MLQRYFQKPDPGDCIRARWRGDAIERDVGDLREQG